MVASQEGHAEVVKELISAGADVNARTKGTPGITALMFASKNGHTEIVNILKQAGAKK